MKRIALLVVLLALVAFLVPTYAGKPVPEPQQVEVVNGPDTAVPVLGDVQVTNTVDADATIINTTANPVPVSLVDGCNKIAISDYVDIIGATYTPGPIITVPADNLFVLTDVVVGHNGADAFDLNVLQDSTTKFSVRVYFWDNGQFVRRDKSFHFNSGIPFASGSNVIIDNKGSSGKVTISGYTTTCF